MRLILVVASLAWLGIGCLSGHAEPRAHRQKIAAIPHSSSFALAGDIAKEPIGWGQICATHSEDCDVGKLPPESIALTKENWATLNRINSLVNDTIEQVSDLEHYGMIEWWAYPDDGKGDCEDLQLLKRRMLMQAGMPRQANGLATHRGTECLRRILDDDQALAACKLRQAGEVAGLPGKIHVLESLDFENWREIAVDYRAEGAWPILAGSDPEHLFLATDNGMILRFIP